MSQPSKRFSIVVAIVVTTLAFVIILFFSAITYEVAIEPIGSITSAADAQNFNRVAKELEHSVQSKLRSHVHVRWSDRGKTVRFFVQGPLDDDGKTLVHKELARLLGSSSKYKIELILEPLRED